MITYSKPVAGSLANLEQLYILPKHVWDKYTGDNGKALKSYFPDQHLPMVSGGPYTVTKYREDGHDRVQAQPVLLRSQVARRKRLR